MGRDKATLSFRGHSLWEHQLRTIRDAGATDVCISGQGTLSYAAERGVSVVSDAEPGKGPLAGIAAALARAEHEYMIVLAIDLPLVPAEFLHELGAVAVRAKRGVIPQRANIFEPLAAVYPRSARPHIDKQLRGPDRSLQRLARLLIADDLAVVYRLAAFEERYFMNINTPEDLARLGS
jgi:molybdopterin-guanine dinucleotide biosynthesis protein A